MQIWMYYQTDGDSGYYHIRLFSTVDKALAYQKKKHNAYSDICRITVDKEDE